MKTKDEIQELLHSTETHRMERTTSTGDMDKFPKNLTISTKELAAMCSLSERQVQRIMAKLKEQGVIRRIGPDKGGRREIIAP